MFIFKVLPREGRELLSLQSLQDELEFIISLNGMSFIVTLAILTAKMMTVKAFQVEFSDGMFEWT